jgi:hypothetical protein
MTLPAKNQPASFNDDPKKLVADAMNEHGFLLQQYVKERIRGNVGSKGDTQDQWAFVATEYPVTAMDGSQTRIDILLKHTTHQRVFMCLECKRPNPRFKKWIFFDKGMGVAGMGDNHALVETIFLQSTPAKPQDVRHYIQGVPSLEDLPVFSAYLEAAVKKEGTSASSTEAAEKAFLQVMKGQSGLMRKLWNIETVGYARAIPVVVTTAELMEADFDPNRITMENGMILPDDLELISMDFCAVNYRPDNSLALPLVAGNFPQVGVNDLIGAQIRTVFVVHTTALTKFLNWAGHHLLSFA